MEEKIVGTIAHYFGKVGVGMVKVSDVLKVGDKIRIKGNTVDFVQDIASMQVNRTDTAEAKAGDEAGIKVSQKVHDGDVVYKIIG
jgi:hypothetical protein